MTGRAHLRARATTIAAVLGSSCVVVSSPGSGDGSTGDASASVGEGPAYEAGGDTAVSPDTAGDPLEPSAFPVYWAVLPASLPVPSGSDAVDIRTGNYVIGPISLGQTPASVTDAQARYDALAADIEATIPADAPPGLGVLANYSWELAWCNQPTEDHDAFAASALGQGLEGDALATAWEEAAAEILVGLVERARATRPQLQWGMAGVPRADYHEVINSADRLREERACSVVDPSNAPLWDAVDFVVPDVRMWYTATSEQPSTLERNRLYIERFIETARLAGKPTIAMLGGRYIRSSDTDDNPYMNLPLLADDARAFVEEARLAGADGFIYALEADSCWNFEEGCDAPNPDDFEVLFEAYWREVMLPPLVELAAAAR
jgi:hypothetical protein